ncbi:metallophosphoesterase family protein [Ureibacillus sinduriensis]|uniref:Phosphoesterase n=2 Tax=Ureibacillus sinduriensis TaxID=561440 RepID=A0A0A3HVP3_9BACL|nr:metallophosphoesterase family protein [Ureibacillus sinduriensis]KGR76686.1 phosphoesterase [Ureibacillus sinduriensis BLB-1 = JCM 15800]
MRYAFLGDLHSNTNDTKAVLQHIQALAPDAMLIGLGDLYECTIGKKKALAISNAPLKAAAIIEEEFEKLLTFPTIRGNQEERITSVTGIGRFAALPERLVLEDATLIHGHQIEWDNQWEPINTATLEIDTSLVFFGHSHRSGLYTGNRKVHEPIHFGNEIKLQMNNYWINVGSVVGNREWCLYDSTHRTIRFMKVPGET